MNKLNRIRLFALGGLSETGKNMLVIEINKDLFVIDAGLKYPELAEKGIDIVLPDFTYLKENKSRLRAYILTHGHDDMIGALPYIIKEAPAPIYCAEITKHLLEQANRKYKLGGRFIFYPVRPTTSLEISGYPFTFFKTTHSIFDSFGVAIGTPQGNIVYTGDYILDYAAPAPYATDLKTISALSGKDTLLLLTESSGAKEAGSASPHHRLTPHIERIFQETHERIFVSLYDSNFYGIGEVIELAVKTRKKIYFYHPEMRELAQKMIDSRVITIPPMTIATSEEMNNGYIRDSVILITGGGTSLFRSLEKISGADSAGLSLRADDLVILAAPYHAGNERLAIKAINDVYRTGAQVTDLKRKRIAGMHARAEDIKMILAMLRPKYYMPIKGEFSSLIANAQLAISIGYNHSNVLVFDNGDVATFENHRLIQTNEKIACEDLMVDGLGIGDVGSVVISDRDRISNEGVLIVAATVDLNKRKIVTNIDVQTRGLIFVKEAEHVIAQTLEIFTEALNSLLKEKNPDINAAKISVRDKISKMIRREVNKDPMILPVIIEL